MGNNGYEELKRLTFGILRSMDLGVVQADTIEKETERQLLYHPDCWLAPAIRGLAAWIADEKDAATRAIEEAKLRNKVKTSLFFALICLREGRKEEGKKWLSFYKTVQKENIEACEYGSAFPGIQVARSIAKKQELKDYAELAGSICDMNKKRIDDIICFLLQEDEEAVEESVIAFEEYLLKAIVRPESLNAGKAEQLFAVAMLKDVLLSSYDGEECDWIRGMSV